MRITEIESQTETEKKGALVTLLNMLKTKADRRETGSKISIDSLNKLMSNLGYSIGYPELDSLVKNSGFILVFFTLNCFFSRNKTYPLQHPQVGVLKTSTLYLFA